MKKVTTLPIGLGFNHLEQEIAASHVWNGHIESSETHFRLTPKAVAILEKFTNAQ